jgi:hypothetical protein
MSRPCTCDRVDPYPAAPFTLDQCRLCWLYHFDPDYRAAWGGDRRRRCRYHGDEVRRQRCASCRGIVELRVFKCSVHGECTIATELSGVGCCAVCPDFEAFA